MRSSSRIVGVVGWAAAALCVPSCTIFDGLQADLAADPGKVLTGNPNGHDRSNRPSGDPAKNTLSGTRNRTAR